MSHNTARGRHHSTYEHVYAAASQYQYFHFKNPGNRIQKAQNEKRYRPIVFSI